MAPAPRTVRPRPAMRWSARRAVNGTSGCRSSSSRPAAGCHWCRCRWPTPHPRPRRCPGRCAPGAGTAGAACLSRPHRAVPCRPAGHRPPPCGRRRQQRPARYANPHADRHPLIGTRQARAGRYLDSIIFDGVFGGQGSMPERRRAPNLAVSSFVALLEFGYPVASGWQLEALACGPAGHACRRRDARQPPRIPRRRAVAAAAGMPLAPSGRRPSPGAPRTRNSNHP